MSEHYLMQEDLQLASVASEIAMGLLKLELVGIDSLAIGNEYLKVAARAIRRYERAVKEQGKS